MTCARCGENKELCNSVIKDGIPDPRVCKECLLMMMKGRGWSINEEYYQKQLEEE